MFWLEAGCAINYCRSNGQLAQAMVIGPGHSLGAGFWHIEYMRDSRMRAYTNAPIAPTHPRIRSPSRWWGGSAPKAETTPV